jgi:hypothetical protein
MLKLSGTATAPSPELLRFAERQVRMAASQTPALERRAEPRQYAVKPVVVQRVDRALQPLGLPLSAVTRDISEQGVGLIFESPTQHDWLAIAFEQDSEDVYLLIEVLWRKPMGPFEYAGGRIAQVLQTFPESGAEPLY